MNLYNVAQALRESRDRDRAINHDVDISTDIEDSKLDGEHTDDDTITLHMPNGDKWRITMEKIN